MSIQVTKTEGSYLLKIDGDHAKQMKGVSAAEGVKAQQLIKEAVEGILASMELPKNYRICEAADMLEISTRTLRRMIAAREIEYVQARPFAHIEIPARSIQAYRDRHTIKAA